MKKRIAALLALLSLGAAGTAQAAFTIGGENGWSLSTDGIVDIFATYHSTSPFPGTTGAARDISILDNFGTQYNQRFGMNVGLLPSVVAFNVKAPTVNGIESTVRIGIYPSLGNHGNSNTAGDAARLEGSDRFSVGPNIDFRELFYTAKGSWGEFLAGRALNLYQGKNILNDMTLLTAGTVGLRAHTVTLGHIASGYLYTGFGPQFRYTTPDFGGAKVAIAVGEPYNISGSGPDDKTNAPRVEAELSYARTFGGVALQGWLSGLYQSATRSDAQTLRPGEDVESIGGAAGIGAGFSGVNLLVSGYGGRGLGTLSVQDGNAISGLFGGSTDAAGTGRHDWGFLAQATYQITPAWKIGANYGQTRQEETDLDAQNRANRILVKNQEAAVAHVVYNLNKFTQFVGEYIYAQNTWHDGAKQHSNQFALGTMFYW